MTTDFQSSVLRELSWRGFIEQITHDELDEHLKTSRTLYCGFDPSSSSLHVGSLVPIMGLAFFHRHGHAPIAVVGGATGRIGDPSGKDEERNLLSDDIIEENLAGISKQLEQVLDRSLEMHPETLAVDPSNARGVTFANNADWFKPWSYLDFLRDVGKYFRVNTMMAKDSVKNRLEAREQGISYTEFSYMLIQGYDFYHLFTDQSCTLQIGGSDQWGNITAGADLVRKKAGGTCFGMTFPLLMMASGKKFGKTEEGAVWLDAERTSPYQFYQYWMNTDDSDCERMFKTFTFLPKDEIDGLLAEIEQGRNRGDVQRRLAAEVTTLVHGEAATKKAIAASRVLFGERIVDFDDKDLATIFRDVPSTTLSQSELETGIGAIDLFHRAGACNSKGEARRLLKQGGGYVNNDRIDADTTVTADHLASETMLVLRSGKKKYRLVKFA